MRKRATISPPVPSKCQVGSQLSGQIDTFFESRDATIELSLEARREDQFEIGAGHEVKMVDQVAPPDKGDRPRVRHVQLSCGFEQPLSGRKAVPGLGWSSALVGTGNPDEAIQSAYAVGEATHSIRSGPSFMEESGGQVVCYQGDDLFDERSGGTEAFEEGDRRSHTGLIVIVRAPPPLDERGGQWFAKIVTEAGESDN